MIKISKAEVEQFFNLYDSRFNEALSGNRPDIDEVVNSFAENFIEASPAGISATKNDQNFRDAVPKGWDYYKNIGVKSMTILQQEITILDDFHGLVKANWQCDYETKLKKGQIAFVVHYLVQKQNGFLKIFTFITGDEQKALKDHGLE